MLSAAAIKEIEEEARAEIKRQQTSNLEKLDGDAKDVLDMFGGGGGLFGGLAKPKEEEKKESYEERVQRMIAEK